MFAGLQFSQFKPEDKGAEYAFHRAAFLRQRPVSAPGAGALGAGVQRADHLMVNGLHVDHERREYDAGMEHRGMRVMSTEGGTYNVEALGALQTGSFNAYHLPWAPNCTYHMTLAGDYGYFFTAPMNGCAVMIRGSRTTPTVYHANYQLSEDAPELIGLSMDHTIERRHRRRREFYTQFETDIAADVVFHPDFYLAPNGVASRFSSVFGFCAQWTREWTFYYHILLDKQPYINIDRKVTVQHKNKPYFITGELWPNYHQPTWRSLLGHYLLGTRGRYGL